MGLINYASVTGVRRSVWIWVSLAILAGGAWAWFILGGKLSTSSVSGESQIYFPVKAMTLDIVLRQAGELQSINNKDITCPVQGQNMIQTIVPEGTFVKEGEVIVTLDSTQHRTAYDSAELELARADSDVKWAIEQKKLQELKNIADLDAANSELALAKIALREYTDGTYPQSVKEATRKLEMADLALKRKIEDVAATRRLMDDGFATAAEIQKANLERITAQNDQEKADTELRVLVEYKHAKESSERQDKVTQAEKKLVRVQSENAASLSQKDSDLGTKQSLLVQRRAARDRAQKMFENCSIKAPGDGMVLYASSTPGYYREAPIQPGTQVYFQQLIVRLPDVTKMKAVVKIPEARVARLRALGEAPIFGDVSIVGVPKPIGAKLTRIGVLPDNADRYINPDAKDYPVDLSLDETPPGLKPGASAQAVIRLGKIEDALTVPLGAIYSVGPDHWVFTRGTPHPQPVQVTTGEANETMIQITNGLAAGQEVLILEAGQGRQLLDLAGIKVKAPEPLPGPASRPASPQQGQPMPNAPVAQPAAPAPVRVAPPVG